MTEAVIYCPADQWTDFYMITASVTKGLSSNSNSTDNFYEG